MNLRSDAKRAAVMLMVLATGAAAVLVPAAPAASATLTVCQDGCLYKELAPALASAHAGDTIRVGPGVYAGGVTIGVSLTLVGAGAGSTVIRGGGPVLTIGSYQATTEPTVSIRGVTITGGVTRTSPQSVTNTGEAGVFAAGGGVEIPPGAGLGATVSISHSVITGNRVAPDHALPLGPACPGGPCPYAGAYGGGIDSWGRLTLSHTTVSHNRVGSVPGLSSVASDAEGAGVMSWQGGLTVTNSRVSDNEAVATAPNGRFADSGGVMVEKGALTMSHSDVRRNRATLRAALPSSVELQAIAGGVHVTDTATATIRHTTVWANSASARNTVGDATAFSGGLHTDVDFTLSDDLIGANSVESVAAASSTGDAEGDSGAGEMGGTITRTRLIGNSVTVQSSHGDVSALAGAVIFGGTMLDSAVRRNRVQGNSPHGSVSVSGGGILSGGRLTLRRTTVAGNTGDARGRTGAARGGGIFAGVVPDGPPAGPLTMTRSRVVRNAVTGGPGITLRGGGVLATSPVTSTQTVVAWNRPDDCAGC